MKISKIISYVIGSFCMFPVFLFLFFVRGSLELGESCPNCIDGQTFTNLDLFSNKNIWAGSIICLIGTIIMIGFFIFEENKSQEAKNG